MERFGILAAIQRRLAESRSLSAPNEAAGHFTLRDGDPKLLALRAVIHDVLSEGKDGSAVTEGQSANSDPNRS